MVMRKKLLLAVFTLLLLASGFASSTVNAKGNEYDAVCNHLKTKYKAKKVKIPFMWLARAAVGIIRPAGVKSFKVTIFKNLQFSRDTLHKEMQSVMKESFGEEWSPILRIRSRNGEQVYMNLRQSGKNLKVLVVTIDGDQAVVVRAKFNPKKLVKFIENPKIFGISLTGGGKKKNGIKGNRVKGDKIIYEEDEDEDSN